MNEQSTMNWDDQLTDKEVYFLGKIVAHWGAIEYEIFSQTLLSFGDQVGDLAELPSQMKNVKFSDVLNLWEARVVRQQSGKRKTILNEQLVEIKRLKDYRNALVHSMLSWSDPDIGVITASRVRNKEYISVKFTGDDLFNFYQQLAKINFDIRCPSGVEDLAERVMNQGGYMSRKGVAMFTGHKILSDWQTLSGPKVKIDEA